MQYARYTFFNIVAMKELTEEEIRNLPYLTKEEQYDIKLTKEDAIKETIRLYLEKAKETDELYDKGLLKLI